jgi:hypothetical protein
MSEALRAADKNKHFRKNAVKCMQYIIVWLPVAKSFQLFTLSFTCGRVFSCLNCSVSCCERALVYTVSCCTRALGCTDLPVRNVNASLTGTGRNCTLKTVMVKS